MYFWRIEKLKTAMATAPLTEREVLPYLIATLVVFYINFGILQHAPVTSLWDDIASLFDIMLVVAGTIYIYQQNNGKNGQHFLQRYLAISWVVSIRWFVGFAIIVIILFVTLPKLNVSEEHTSLILNIFSCIVEVILYWRTGHHVHDLANRTITA